MMTDLIDDYELCLKIDWEASWLTLSCCCWQLKGELSVGVVNSVLDGVVAVSRRRGLYGGDLRSLMSILTDTVDQSASSLLPTVDTSLAANLTTTINAVCCL